MPCIDAEMSEAMSRYDDEKRLENYAKTTASVTGKINTLTKILCDISHLPPETPIKNLNKLVDNYASFVLKHREEDQERWYQKYKDKYPKFNKREIVKMVREGILPD